MCVCLAAIRHFIIMKIQWKINHRQKAKLDKLMQFELKGQVRIGWMRIEWMRIGFNKDDLQGVVTALDFIWILFV